MSDRASKCPVDAAGPVFDLDSPEFRRDRDSFYRRLLRTAPVYQHPSGAWLLSRHRDITRVLESSELRNVENIRCYPDAAFAGAADDPSAATLARVRRAVARTLAPAKVRTFQTRVQQIVDGLLDDAVDAGEFDLVTAFCHPLAAVVFCELFGVPASDRTQFREWVDAITRGVDFDSTIVASADLAEQRDRARSQFVDYFGQLITERRRQPTDDLLGALVAIHQDAPDHFSAEDLAASCIILMIAGHESSVHFLSNSTLALLEHPDQLAKLSDEPDLAPTAIEELMRYVSPAQFTVRIASTDITIDGHRIREGSHVLVLLAAANRDPEVFDDPDRLDLGRQPNPHLAFGHGQHFCLGAALARVEGSIGLTSLFRRIPTLALAGEPVAKAGIAMRGIDRLPLRRR